MNCARRDLRGGCSVMGIPTATGELPQRYYLSSTACRGILRRAEKRGKELPWALQSALLAVASQIPHQPLTLDAKTVSSAIN